jgi:hypothetical protein
VDLQAAPAYTPLPFVQLTELAHTLAYAQDDAVAETCCKRAFELFVSAAPAAASALRATESTTLPSGIALAPALAANCLLDARRTRAFVRGLLQAVEAARQQLPSGVVEVLYAGSGPFAPLALLALPLLERDDTHLTILDIHEESIACAASLLRTFALDRCTTVIRADASRYRHGRELHIVISETLQRSLRHEPFVAIRENLQGQLAPGGAFLPETVRVDLATITANAGDFRHVDRVIESSGRRLMVTGAPIPLRAQEHRGRWPALITTLHVFREERLRPYDSGLTQPDILWELTPLSTDVDLQFGYRSGPAPGPTWQSVRPPVSACNTLRPFRINAQS